MNTLPPVVVRKGQYAMLKNVSAGRVSQWIAEGKIGSDALVGEGRSARINIALADAHLQRNLDLNQQLANGLSTRADALSQFFAEQSLAADTGPIEEQLKREKLEGMQRENRKRALEEAARAGRYVEAAAAGIEMRKIAGAMITILDGALPEIAAALSAQFSLSQRDVLHRLRAEFRNVRERAANSLRTASEQLPVTIEAELGDLDATDQGKGGPS